MRSMNNAIAISFAKSSKRASIRKSLKLMGCIHSVKAIHVTATTNISVSAVNSALQRARVRLRERLPSHKPSPASVDGSAAERDLLKKYVEASETADFRAFESIIRADATFRMPPEPGTAAGREAMFKAWVEGGYTARRSRLGSCALT